VIDDPVEVVDDGGGGALRVVTVGPLRRIAAAIRRGILPGIEGAERRERPVR